MGEYSLVLPFDTDNPEFGRGIEIGRLWEQLKTHHDEITVTLHASNTEMAMRVAEATGRTFKGRGFDGRDDWIIVTFGKSPEESEA